jgi:GTPase SAR1 family protein
MYLYPRIFDKSTMKRSNLGNDSSDSYSYEEIKTPRITKIAKTNELNENEMFQIIANLVSLSKICDVDLDVLHLIVLGDQATGKSTLLNRLIGYDLLPSRTGSDFKNNKNLEAKTLCPITLHTINKQGNFYITIKSPNLNQTVEVETLESVQKHVIDILDQIQLSISGGDAFNNNLSIEVTVEGPGIKNMHFVDLPGNRNDTEHIGSKINMIIEQQVTKNKNAIILFLINGSTDPAVTSTWNIINKIPNKNDIVLVLTRPDGRGNDDGSLIHFLDSCEQKSKIPRSNIFIVKNYDTTDKHENPQDKEYDSTEMMWFMHHNVYSRYTDHPDYSSHLGKANLNGFIIDKLKNKIIDQIPRLQITIKKLLKTNEDERNRLGSRLTIKTNVDRAYEFFNSTKFFLQKLDDTLKGKSNPQLAIKFKHSVLQFKTDISSIPFNGNLSHNEILSMVTNSGGIDIKILGSDDEIVHHVLFDQANSPYRQLLTRLDQYIDYLHLTLSQIVQDIDCKESKIDSNFWQSLKDVLLTHLDKENLRMCFVAFCRTQKHNYDQYLIVGGPEDRTYKNIPNNTFKYNPIDTIEKFWKSIVENVGQNFPKYVKEFLIEENISKFDNILKENMETLYLLIKEPDCIENRRTRLDDGIMMCKNILQLSANFINL